MKDMLILFLFVNIPNLFCSIFMCKHKIRNSIFNM